MVEFKTDGYWYRGFYHNGVRAFGDDTGKWFTLFSNDLPVDERIRIFERFAEALDEDAQTVVGVGMICIEPDNDLGLETAAMLFFGEAARKREILDQLRATAARLGLDYAWTWKSAAQTERDWQYDGALFRLRMKKIARGEIEPIRDDLVRQFAMIGEHLFRMGYRMGAVDADPRQRQEPALADYCDGQPLDEAPLPPMHRGDWAFHSAVEKLRAVVPPHDPAYDELRRLLDAANAS